MATPDTNAPQPDESNTPQASWRQEKLGVLLKTIIQPEAGLRRMNREAVLKVQLYRKAAAIRNKLLIQQALHQLQCPLIIRKACLLLW